MSDYLLKKVGQRIKRVRKSLGLQQEKFGEILEVSRSSISEIEKGNVRFGFDLLYKMSHILNVNLNYLFHGKGDIFPRNGVGEAAIDLEIGDPVGRLQDLMWYLERSPIMLHNILGMANKFIYDNEAYIRKDVDKYLQKMEERQIGESTDDENDVDHEEDEEE